MGATLPYSQIVGPATIYVAPAGEAPPTINATPGGNWVELGPTEGDQAIAKEGANTYWSDNSHTSHVLARTPEEIKKVLFTLVNMRQEQVARVLHNISQLITAAGPPATSLMPSKSGYVPSEYAILVYGAFDSPNGLFPGFDYTPRGVFEKNMEFKRSKTQRYEVACEYHALEDDTQSSGRELGWQLVQTS